MPEPKNHEPLTEEQIQAAWVGEPPVHAAPIELAEYDPSWPELFRREEERIRAALGERVVQLEHVGSTAVPGLAAKPVIDMCLVVADSSDEEAYVPALEAAGYVLRIRELEWYEHRCLKGPDTNVNLHVYSEGLPGDRAVPALPRPATHQPDRPRAVRENQARSGQAGMEVRPELRRRQDGGRRRDHRPRLSRVIESAPAL